MSAAVTVRSSEILRTFDIQSAYLHRWRAAGLIRPETEPAPGRPATWPDWTLRIVALIRTLGYNGWSTLPTARMTAMEVLRACAEILERDPDVPWVVFTEGGDALACYHAAEVVAVHRRQTCTTVVAIPSLDEARNP